MVKKPQTNYITSLLFSVITLGLVAVVTVQIVENLTLIKEADAQRGCPINTPAPNASKGRCFLGSGGPFASEVNPSDSDSITNSERSVTGDLSALEKIEKLKKQWLELLP